MFIGFANFYWRFIQDFSKIAISLIFLLKITRLSKKLVLEKFNADKNEIVSGSGNRANETVINLSKNLTCMPNIRATGEPTFLTPNAKKIFNYL